MKMVEFEFVGGPFDGRHGRGESPLGPEILMPLSRAAREHPLSAQEGDLSWTPRMYAAKYKLRDPGLKQLLSGKFEYEFVDEEVHGGPPPS